jgi:hypothetical protein
MNKKEQNKIIHYTHGYGGKLNYLTICGLEIHSHSDTDGATIDPVEVSCKKCRKTAEWIEDYGYSTGETKTDIKRRIFIESDILHADELERAQRQVYRLCNDNGVKHIRRVFDEVLDHAWHHLEKTWEAVKKADEIYADSSLMPLCGGSYMGAPVIFNGMMERAIKEKITGKSVVILNSLKNINWYMIKLNLMEEAFFGNKLLMYDEERNLIEVDVKRVVKDQKKNKY